MLERSKCSRNERSHCLVDGDASLEEEVEKVLESLAGQGAKPLPQPKPTST